MESRSHRATQSEKYPCLKSSCIANPKTTQPRVADESTEIQEDDSSSIAEIALPSDSENQDRSVDNCSQQIEDCPSEPPNESGFVILNTYTVVEEPEEKMVPKEPIPSCSRGIYRPYKPYLGHKIREPISNYVLQAVCDLFNKNCKIDGYVPYPYDPTLSQYGNEIKEENCEIGENNDEQISSSTSQYSFPSADENNASDSTVHLSDVEINGEFNEIDETGVSSEDTDLLDKCLRKRIISSSQRPCKKARTDSTVTQCKNNPLTKFQDNLLKELLRKGDPKNELINFENHNVQSVECVSNDEIKPTESNVEVSDEVTSHQCISIDINELQMFFPKDFPLLKFLENTEGNWLIPSDHPLLEYLECKIGDKSTENKEEENIQEDQEHL